LPILRSNINPRKSLIHDEGLLAEVLQVDQHLVGLLVVLYQRLEEGLLELADLQDVYEC